MPPSSTRASAEEDAPLQSGWGGLAGSTVHPLALGNVARLAQLLRTRTGDERLRGIVLIGVGGAGDAEAVERFRRAGADAVVSLFFFSLYVSLFSPPSLFPVVPTFLPHVHTASIPDSKTEDCASIADDGFSRVSGKGVRHRARERRSGRV